MRLYHGSIGGLQFPIRIDYSNNPCDFGQGFYLGDMKEQAENRVCNVPDNVIYEMELRLDELSIYRFEDEILWALFVGVNRGRIDVSDYKKLESICTGLNEEYDAVVGLIADDKIAQSFNRFLDGDLTDIALCECLKYVRYGSQYVLKKQRAIDSLNIISKYTMDAEERKNSLIWGQSQKKSLDESLDGIRLKYRREGRFVDEILEEYR